MTTVHIVRFTSEADIKEFAEKMETAAGWDFAGWRFIPIECLVIDRENREIRLTRRQSQILETIIRRFPHPIEAQTIARKLNMASANSVKTQIHTLRERIGPGVILSYQRSKKGYWFSGMTEPEQYLPEGWSVTNRVVTK